MFINRNRLKIQKGETEVNLLGFFSVKITSNGFYIKISFNHEFFSEAFWFWNIEKVILTEIKIKRNGFYIKISLNHEFFSEAFWFWNIEKVILIEIHFLLWNYQLSTFCFFWSSLYSTMLMRISSYHLYILHQSLF